MADTVPRRSTLPGAVLFDLDDTLFDHSLTCRAAIAQVRRGRPELRTVPVDRLWSAYLEAFAGTHVQVLQGRLTMEEARLARWRSVLERYGGGIRTSRVRALADEYRRAYLARERAVPGAAALLRRLHGRTAVAVVTSHLRSEQERKLRVLGLDRWIGRLIVPHDVGVDKPHPAIFRAALAWAGVRPDDAAMIGDSWELDVVGAARAGVRPIWLNRFGRPRPPGPRATEIRSLRPAAAVERVLAAPGRSPSARIISRGRVERR